MELQEFQGKEPTFNRIEASPRPVTLASLGIDVSDASVAKAAKSFIAAELRERLRRFDTKSLAALYLRLGGRPSSVLVANHRAYLDALQAWARAVAADPDGMLAAGTSNGELAPDLFSLSDLVEAYKFSSGRAITRSSRGTKCLSLALTKAGLPKTDRVRTKIGRITLFAVRNFDKYRNLSAPEIGRIYDHAVRTIKFGR